MKQTHETLSARPVLKWAGGKGQLLRQIQAHLPDKITRYAEPFVGSGAVFFFIAQTYHPKDLYISDRNPDLILLYQVIQNSVEHLIEILSELQVKFYALSKLQQAEFFYQVRQEFNSSTVVDEYSRVLRAAQMIFLNRTCFNGLFRVNAQGKFNVPFGDYKQPKICDRLNLMAVSHILKDTQIVHADFTACAQFCNSETFVYFDPPYRPLSKTANFNAYSTDNFPDAEQERLANFCQYLDQQGVRWLLSNSDPHNTDPYDQFFDILYQPFCINRIQGHRMINSDATKRTAISEILVKNY